MRKFSNKVISALLGLIALACSQNPSENMDLLLGTYTGSGSEGIYLLSFNPETGKLTNPRLAARIGNPSYLAVSNDGHLVYSVGERDTGGIAAFDWKEGADSLELINEVSAQGAAPCYIDFSQEKQLVAIANYVTGDGAFYRVRENGALEANPVIYRHEGSGPNENRQRSPHAHCSIFSKNGQFVYVVDLGIDKVMGYPVDSVGIKDTLTGFTAFDLQPGDGPRHLVFHPKEDYAFIVNELSNTVVSARVDVASGRFELIDRMSTLPEDFTAHSQCADIHITSDGNYLYASNRGHNSIAVFKVGKDAFLNRVQVEPVRGDWPRNFTLSPNENFLIVANERSDNITVFSLDKETGRISFTGNEIALSKPVCLKFRK